jgi:hypothetical protein
MQIICHGGGENTTRGKAVSKAKEAIWKIPSWNLKN